MMPSLKKIQALILADLPDAQGLYLFGSVATQQATPESDLDLAVLGKRPYEAKQLWDTAQKIAALTKCDVDLVDLQSASTLFKNQILTNGQRFYAQDEFFCNLFETTALSSYLRFNEARAGIIEDIRKRGSVF